MDIPPNAKIGYRGWYLRDGNLLSPVMYRTWIPNEPLSDYIWAWRRRKGAAKFGNLWGAIYLWGHRYSIPAAPYLVYAFGYPKEFWYSENRLNWCPTKREILELAKIFGIEAVPLPKEVRIKSVVGKE